VQVVPKRKLACGQLQPATNRSQNGIKHKFILTCWLLFYYKKEAHHVSRAYSNFPGR
jgi:hypothetical protein